MTDAAKIREVCERNVRLLSQKPHKGHLTGITKARIEEGVRCLIEEGPWQLAADMPVKAGGDETAPTPGMLGRGALAGCLAIGSPASQQTLTELLDTAERHSPYLNVFSRPQPMKRLLCLNGVEV